MFDSVEAEYNDGFFQYQAGLQVNDGIYDEFYFTFHSRRRQHIFGRAGV